jgi:hypothetical protein
MSGEEIVYDHDEMRGSLSLNRIKRKRYLCETMGDAGVLYEVTIQEESKDSNYVLINRRGPGYFGVETRVWEQWLSKKDFVERYRIVVTLD